MWNRNTKFRTTNNRIASITFQYDTKLKATVAELNSSLVREPISYKTTVVEVSGETTQWAH